MRALFALFIRSIREDTRAKLPVFLRVALIGIILLIIWSSHRNFTQSSAPGLAFFTAVMMLNLGFIALAALSLFPSAITEEKEDETLPLLRMTNLNPLSILLGKSTARLLSALLLLAVQIPFTLLAITLGGISFGQILIGYAILAATTFFLCNLALLASVISRTTLRASILVGVTGVALYIVLPAFASANSFGRMFGRGNTTPAWTESLSTFILRANPAYATATLMGPLGSFSVLSVFGLPSIAFALIAGALCFLLAWLLFDRFCSGTEATLGRRKKATRRASARPQNGRVWQRWPIVWKEMHHTIGGRRGFWKRLALAAAIYLGVFLFVSTLHISAKKDYWQIASSITLFIIVWVIAIEIALAAARLFGAEREQQTLSSLITLPWSIGRIVCQKILGTLPALAPWLLLGLLACIPFRKDIWQEILRLIDQSNWEYFRHTLPTLTYLTSQSLLFLTTIVWLSLRIRRGAIPAAIVIYVLWNIVFAMFINEIRSVNETSGLYSGILLTLLTLAYLAKSIHHRIQTAAAEA